MLLKRMFGNQHFSTDGALVFDAVAIMMAKVLEMLDCFDHVVPPPIVGPVVDDIVFGLVVNLEASVSCKILFAMKAKMFLLLFFLSWLIFCFLIDVNFVDIPLS